MTKVGELLRNVVREGDLVVRFGGEEFVIVICNISKEDMNSRAESIRSLLDSSIEYDNKTITFSTSIGCYHTKSLQHNLDQILRHADKQLYKAKHSGRNRFKVVYD
jgi:diguanylate cyclase (GGDEF)-like protein